MKHLRNRLLCIAAAACLTGGSLLLPQTAAGAWVPDCDYIMNELTEGSVIYVSQTLCAQGEWGSYAEMPDTGAVFPPADTREEALLPDYEGVWKLDSAWWSGGSWKISFSFVDGPNGVPDRTELTYTGTDAARNGSDQPDGLIVSETAAVVRDGQTVGQRLKFDFYYGEPVVQYLGSDGTPVLDSDLLIAGSTEWTLPPDIPEAPAGMQFAGWTINGGYYAPGDTIAVTSGVNKVTAVWEPMIQTVHFAANGGAGTMPDDQAAYGAAYLLPICQQSKTRLTGGVKPQSGSR